MKKSSSILPLIAILSFLILAVVVIFAVQSHSRSSVDSDDLQAGIDYLRALEEKPVTDVEETLQYQRDHDFAAKREERLAQLESGEISCWSLFEDFLICGDSRCVAYYHYGFLPESNIIAVDGGTIRNLEQSLQDIIDRSPKRLFLCYGMNDFCAGIWDSTEAWTTEYSGVIEQLHEALPNTYIYVSCIIPVGEIAYERTNIWVLVPDWNAALEEMCGGLDYCTYMDFVKLGEEHEDLYLSDGVHFNEEFYGYLGEEIIMYVFDTEFPRDDSADGDSSASDIGES